MNNLPSHLRYLRNVAGMTQAAAARHVGLEPAALSRFETGERTPPIEALEKILAVYGYTLSIVPVDAPPAEDVKALTLLAQAGEDLDDAVASLLYDENAGSLMERMDILARVHSRFQQIRQLVKKGQDDEGSDW